jgi:rare lipoprotein A
VVRVVNLKNGKSVIVTITDRGPHPRLSRAIDLSEAAAGKLDYIDKGLTSVFIIPVAKAQYESAPITAQLIGPAVDAPVRLEATTAKIETVSAQVPTGGLGQSR